VHNAGCDRTDKHSFGVIGAIVFRQALRIKFSSFALSLRWVDAGDTFATHCIGGILGTVMTGMFASKEVAAYDGFTDIAGGAFVDGNLGQIGIQVLEATIGFVWAFGVSYLIYALIDCIPGLEVLAVDAEVEIGMDAAQMEESFGDSAWADELEYKPYAEGVVLE
jgi:ammonia channel protein AmtB